VVGPGLGDAIHLTRLAYGEPEAVVADPGDTSTSEVTTVTVPIRAEYTPAHRMIVAATRLRDAWAVAKLDVGEIHEAALGLISATGTKNLQSALDIHDAESGHGLCHDR
jgi:hypothetical protein